MSHQPIRGQVYAHRPIRRYEGHLKAWFFFASANQKHETLVGHSPHMNFPATDNWPSTSGYSPVSGSQLRSDNNHPVVSQLIVFLFTCSFCPQVAPPSLWWVRLLGLIHSPSPDPLREWRKMVTEEGNRCKVSRKLLLILSKKTECNHQDQLGCVSNPTLA